MCNPISPCLWKNNERNLILKLKERGFHTNLFHDGVQLSDAKEIATAFKTYFVNIGKKLAAYDYDIDHAFDDFQQYLDTPAKTRLQFNCITVNKTIKAIDRLENKSNSGHDGLSNIFLNLVKNDLKIPLTLKINQMITIVIYPVWFKISKITLLYEKDNHYILTHYRPILLLPTKL